MANNRMYLRCPHCPDAKPVMIAKYSPSGGWTTFPECFDLAKCFASKLDEFFEQHRHDSQWGNGFLIEYEIAPDYAAGSQWQWRVSRTDPFPEVT